MRRNYFIFEGIDGSGKTTAMQHVAIRLLEAGVPVILTKEPGGPFALINELQIEGLTDHVGVAYTNGPVYRNLCFDKSLNKLVHRAIHRADSLENFFRVVLPAIESGAVVLSDRGWPSDIAYGMAFGDMPFEDMMVFNRILEPRQITECTVVWFRIEPSIANERLKGNESNFYDDPSQAAKRLRVHEGYAKLATVVPNVETVDASLPLEEVVECVTNMILSYRRN